MNMDDRIFIGGVTVMIMIALLAVVFIQIAYGGRQECVFFNLGCKWVDHESECIKVKHVRTDVALIPISTGKSMILMPVTDPDYLYNCTTRYDNGTVVKYQEVE